MDTCASGLGAVTASWLTKRNAKANAEALLIEAKAQADAHRILADASQDSAEADTNGQETSIVISDGSTAIQSRLFYQEAKRQKNLVQIAQVATDEIPDSVSDEPVDEDWVARFFNHAQDISNEELQEIWGKILAGEVANPNTFSLRTLDILRNISTEEAQLISQLKPLIFGQTDQIYKIADETSPLYIDMRAKIRLQEIGIIGDSGLGITSKYNSTTPGKYYAHFIVGKTVIFLEHEDENKTFEVQIYALTKSGQQIISVVAENTSDLAVESVIDLAKNAEFKVSRAEVMEWLPDGLRHGDILQA
jgi:hypothetical protein